MTRWYKAQSYAITPGYEKNPLCDPSPSVDYIVGGFGAIILLSMLMNVTGFCLGGKINPFCHPVSRGISFGWNTISLLGVTGALTYRHMGGCKNL